MQRDELNLLTVWPRYAPFDRVVRSGVPAGRPIAGAAASAGAWLNRCRKAFLPQRVQGGYKRARECSGSSDSSRASNEQPPMHVITHL